MKPNAGIQTLAALFSVIFLSTGIFMEAGCSPSKIKKATKMVARDLKSSNKGLKRKVGVIPFENKSVFTDQKLEELLQHIVIETIEKICPDILLTKPGDADYPAFLAEPKRLASGSLDNFALAKEAKQFGLNSVITGSLISITGNQEERGILLWKDMRHMIQVHLAAEVFDMETAAKLLDEGFMDEIEVDETTFDLIKEKKLQGISELTDALTKRATDIGEKITDIICEHPCRGYVVSIIGEKIILSSGENIGMKVGDILEVYSCNNIIEGTNGEKFCIPGFKTGEIKITEVYPEKAEAVIVSGKTAGTGSAVKTKK
ncbi:MAG TPA: hypothetical protein PKV75_04195 [Desulfobacterales bacterium]|nr:hypothetical protein [Desulfobacterales bacterium]